MTPHAPFDCPPLVAYSVPQLLGFTAFWEDHFSGRRKAFFGPSTQEVSLWLATLLSLGHEISEMVNKFGHLTRKRG